MTALHTGAKRWKQLKGPSVDKCIKKMWYIHTMEDHSAAEREKVLTHTAVWMKLENSVFSEKSKTPKDRYWLGERGWVFIYIFRKRT